jgi:5'-methylthioadenosine phosphorylase
VCDQFVDRTRGREDTFYDGGADPVTHVSAAEPYCPELRSLLVESARDLGIPVRDGGSVVVIQGPRFSTRAESAWFSAMGWDVVNMTAYPEAHLARELELCYATLAMVTDHDAGVAGVEPVSAGEVIEAFERNLARLRELLFALIPKIAPPGEHLCTTALRGARIGA